MSGKFSEAEIEVAEELVRERLEKGPSSGYFFCFVEQAGKPLGYACYGPVPGTLASWDLYWIVVAGNRQGGGLGSAILARVEKSIRLGGGKSVLGGHLFPGRIPPHPAFYRAKGYENQAVLTDFYRPGDHKVILCKRPRGSLGRSSRARKIAPGPLISIPGGSAGGFSLRGGGGAIRRTLF